MERDYSEEERYLRAQKKIKEIKGFYAHLFWYVVVNLFLSFGGAFRQLFRGEDMDFDFHFGFSSVWFFWGIGLAFHWFGVFGKNIVFSKDWEDRKIKEFMDSDKFESN